MAEAILHIRAKTENAWIALGPAVDYLLKTIKASKREASQCGMKWHLSIEEGEKAHTILISTKLPLTVELIVEQYQ